MSIATTTKRYTFEEFCRLIKDGQKADLIDGVIYVASPDNFDANRLQVWLGSLLEYYVDTRDLGETFESGAAFRLAENQGPEPDLAFVRKKRLHLKRRGHFEGAPDLAIEIVSPESIDRDYEKKREQYRQAGVREYWIVDEMEQRLTLLRLTTAGEYREVRPRKGVLRSRVIRGFWLRPEWLWQQPRPKLAAVTAELLKE